MMRLKASTAFALTTRHLTLILVALPYGGTPSLVDGVVVISKGHRLLLP